MFHVEHFVDFTRGEVGFQEGVRVQMGFAVIMSFFGYPHHFCLPMCTKCSLEALELV